MSSPTCDITVMVLWGSGYRWTPTKRIAGTSFCDNAKGLVTKYGDGGLQHGRGSFTPTKRGGGGKSFSHAEGGAGGHNKFWGSFYVVALSGSHIEGGGGHTKFALFKRGGGMKGFTLF